VWSGNVREVHGAGRSGPVDGGGLLAVHDRLAAWLSASGVRSARVACGGALAMVLCVPSGLRLPREIVHHSRWYQGVSAEPLHAAAGAGVGPRALIYVAGTPWVYSSFFPANGLDPATASRVYVREVPGLAAQARTVYARPETWRVTIEAEFVPPDSARLRQMRWERLP
jgi:hypothetical protein